MPLPFIKLIPGVLKTVAKVAGLAQDNPLAKAADVLENISIPPEKQAEMQAALQLHEQAMKALSIEELKTVLSESQLMLQSEDKYISRARPTMIYAGVGVGIFLTVIVGLVLIKHVVVDWGAVAIIGQIMAAFFGTMGWYTTKRTEEKLNGKGT